MENRKNIYILVGAVALIVVAVLAYLYIAKPALDNRTVMVPVSEEVENEELGVSFSYPSGVDQLTLMEPPLEEGPLKGAYILMSTEARLASEQSGATTTPPSTTILVFSKPQPAIGAPELSRIDELRDWANKNQALTGIVVAEAEPELVEVDGVSSLKYSAHSNYKQDYHLMSYKDNIYMFVGQYEQTDDFMHTAYKNLMTTVSFD